MTLRPTLQSIAYCVSKNDTDVAYCNCSVVHWLTPLLRGIGCVLSGTAEGAKNRRVHRAGGVGAEYMWWLLCLDCLTEQG